MLRLYLYTSGILIVLHEYICRAIGDLRITISAVSEEGKTDIVQKDLLVKVRTYSLNAW